MSRHMWMVRAGSGAYRIDEFENKKIVAIGWRDVKDLSKFKDSTEIKERVKEKYPDYNTGQITSAASQISKFRFDFQEGDYAISYDPERRIYLVGEIISDYEFNPKLSEFPHIRKVKWLGKVNRDDISTSTKNTLGAISTIFEIKDEAKEEILKLLKGEKKIETDKSKETEEAELKEDMELKAHEFIKDRVSNLNWEEMQDLVAGILRAMGYKTIVSAKGADRGKDIVASPDGLGLEEPRIRVEVKHRSGQMGSKQIRGLLGGLRPGDKSLYVSTGGFTKDAKYEAERSNIPLTLVDIDLLVELIIQYYDNFDPDTKKILPLTKIYWPT